MFYHEQRTQLGRWSPITTPHRPEQRKDGRLGKAGGVGPMIRRVKRVEAEHEGLTLAALQAGYGHDGDGWREPGEGAETAPVFRSGRAGQ